MQERSSDLQLLVEAAEEAGRIALAYFRHDPKNWTKAGDSPVSEADIASNDFLLATLGGARPDYGWLSEETADTPDRLQKDRVFVIDPIDGTRGFIEGNPDWCVSVAIVEAGRPIAGVLSVPARNELYATETGTGAWLNGARIAIGGRDRLEGGRISGPIRHMKALSGAFHLAERRFTPSLAYRFALVAADRLDLATARPHAHDWDLAAVDLLMHEAGGMLADLTGAKLRYNKAEPRHPALIAASPTLLAAAAPVVADAESRHQPIG